MSPIQGRRLNVTNLGVTASDPISAHYTGTLPLKYGSWNSNFVQCLLVFVFFFFFQIDVAIGEEDVEKSAGDQMMECGDRGLTFSGSKPHPVPEKPRRSLEEEEKEENLSVDSFFGIIPPASPAASAASAGWRE